MTYESVRRMNSYEGFAMPTIFHRANINASEIILCCETVTHTQFNIICIMRIFVWSFRARGGVRPP